MTWQRTVDGRSVFLQGDGWVYDYATGGWYFDPSLTTVPTGAPMGARLAKQAGTLGERPRGIFWAGSDWPRKIGGPLAWMVWTVTTAIRGVIIYCLVSALWYLDGLSILNDLGPTQYDRTEFGPMQSDEDEAAYQHETLRAVNLFSRLFFAGGGFFVLAFLVLNNAQTVTAFSIFSWRRLTRSLAKAADHRAGS